jgi:hypothetical protein
MYQPLPSFLPFRFVLALKLPLRAAVVHVVGASRRRRSSFSRRGLGLRIPDRWPQWTYPFFLPNITPLISVRFFFAFVFVARSPSANFLLHSPGTCVVGFPPRLRSSTH